MIYVMSMSWSRNAIIHAMPPAVARVTAHNLPKGFWAYMSPQKIIEFRLLLMFRLMWHVMFTCMMTSFLL